jgi:hypothetical protein
MHHCTLSCNLLHERAAGNLHDAENASWLAVVNIQLTSDELAVI